MKLSRVMMVVLLGVMSVGLWACHTVKGMGEDISAGGDAISHAADDDSSK